MEDENMTQDTHHLKYRPGDLIIKENDFGVSVYKIIKGQVEIVTESGGKEIQLGVLGPGQVIGEILFLSPSSHQRSASARAVEDVELEVWHPNSLKKEYEAMPPILKNIADQALERLVIMNRLVVRLSSKPAQAKVPEKQIPEKQVGDERDTWVSKREFYRKKVDLSCTCKSLDTKTEIPGSIEDLSMGGLGVKVQALRSQTASFKIGNKFLIKATLPNGKPVDFTAEIASINSEPGNPKMFWGMSFVDLPEGSRRDLGFFLMPT
jgi:hypothetical protein